MFRTRWSSSPNDAVFAWKDQSPKYLKAFGNRGKSMAILASISGSNLFSALPTNPPPSGTPSTASSTKPPIPIPKYPPPSKSRRNFNPERSGDPAFKTHHRNSKYYKPVKPGQKITTADSDDRAIIVGNSGISYQLPGAPFEFMYSYSETPKAQPLAMREPAFLPFAPPTMPRPWTGKAPLKKSKRNVKLFEPLGVDESDNHEDDGVKKYEMLRAYKMGRFITRPREEVLGEPLTKSEIKEMLKPCLSSNKQVNLGRDGLIHNMLELIHSHWRRQPVCKVRCLGIPTVDMDNICSCLEERTGGKVIHRAGGVVYLFRGRNYDHKKRPQLPVMLWKPAAPVYPKLIQDAPEGLTKEEADELRIKGKTLLPICKLSRNGVYISLVSDVRHAFEGSILVKIDCRGLESSDYKKLGAKLKELVPCVLLSFDDEQILMWRGRDWKSMYHDETPRPRYIPSDPDAKASNISPKMMYLWEKAVDSGKASVVENLLHVNPDELLSMVEEFDRTCQAKEHSYAAVIYPNSESAELQDETGETRDHEPLTNDDEWYIDESSVLESDSALFGSLPVDLIAKELGKFGDDN